MLRTESSGKATITRLKKHNEGLILSAIYGHDAISRVQLARLTHLSRPSVTELTHGLIENNLITEVGVEHAPARVGKRPTLLAFNADASHLLAVDMGGTKVIAALLDLRGRVLFQERRAIDGRVRDQPLTMLIEAIETVIKQATRPLLGIAVGTPGIVDTQAGIVHFASNLGWNNLPLTHILSERFHVPVYIGNDTNLAALGEYRFGSGQGIPDLFVIMLGTGIGSGILAGGRIVEGFVYGAGEIGHMPVGDLDGLCRCGKYGCLETIGSGWGLAEHAQRIAQEHRESLLNQLSGGEPISARTVQQAVEANDAQAIALVKKMGNYMGLALVSVIHLLNPRRVILGGSLIGLGDIFLDQVQQTVKERALDRLAENTDIVPSELGDRVIVLGAGALLLEQELGLWQ